MYSLEGKSLQECNRKILEELTAAGIHTQEIPFLSNVTRGVVNANIIGIRNSYIFIRSWYFYTAYGKIPIAMAKELEVLTSDCRIDGNFGGWTVEEYLKKYPLASYVNYYQIDSVEGLQCFCKLLDNGSYYADKEG